MSLLYVYLSAVLEQPPNTGLGLLAQPLNHLLSYGIPKVHRVAWNLFESNEI